MVRPIEISDVLSKVQAAERVQQNAKAVTEATQQFQRELGEKLADAQVTTTQPATQGDRIILHAEEQKREKDRKEEEKPASARSKREAKRKNGEESGPDSGSGNPDGHIDIRV